MAPPKNGKARSGGIRSGLGSGERASILCPSRHPLAGDDAQSLDRRTVLAPEFRLYPHGVNPSALPCLPRLRSVSTIGD